MKLVHNNIVVVEAEDTQTDVIVWVEKNTDIGQMIVTSDHWVHTLKEGDVIFFNPINQNNAMYKLNVNMVNNSGRSDIGTLTTLAMLQEARKELAESIGKAQGLVDPMNPVDIHYGMIVGSIVKPPLGPKIEPHTFTTETSGLFEGLEVQNDTTE